MPVARAIAGVCACALALAASISCFAEDVASESAPASLGLRVAARTPDDPESQQPIRLEDTPRGRSAFVPAVELLGFGLALNRFDYYFIDKQTFRTTVSSIRRNLHARWVFDNDPFSVNQFMHPYQGTVFFGLARSTGLDYWHSLAYSFGGSFLWEIAGETTLPSINDLIATGIGGTFLGEPLYRMASLLLENGGEKPGPWRETGAALISPALGFNRLLMGDRFTGVFDSRHPAYFSELRVGGSNSKYVRGQGVSQVFRPNEGLLEYQMAYGLPGEPGYKYTRPFDYFDFRLTSSSANGFESIMSRGLLTGKDYAFADNYRGVWGLYGSYDYIAPQLYRVSSTALSLGTTAQWWLSKELALQGTVLGGLGYGAGGTIHGTGERDYHYGATPQALASLSFIFGERAKLDVAARGYFISRVFSTEDRGSEHLRRIDAAFTWRFHGPHAITLKYVDSERKAGYPDIDNRLQKVGTVSLLYSYLFDADPGSPKFGAIDWRRAGPSS